MQYIHVCRIYFFGFKILNFFLSLQNSLSHNKVSDCSGTGTCISGTIGDFSSESNICCTVGFVRGHTQSGVTCPSTWRTSQIHSTRRTSRKLHRPSSFQSPTHRVSSQSLFFCSSCICSSIPLFIYLFNINSDNRYRTLTWQSDWGVTKPPTAASNHDTVTLHFTVCHHSSHQLCTSFFGVTTLCLKKRCYFCFFNNLVKHWSVLIIFGMRKYETTWCKWL